MEDQESREQAAERVHVWGTRRCELGPWLLGSAEKSLFPASAAASAPVRAPLGSVIPPVLEDSAAPFPLLSAGSLLALFRGHDTLFHAE